MPDQTIKCPKCGLEIPLTEALTGQIESSIREKYEAEATKKIQEIENQKQALKKQQKELEEKEQSFSERVDEKVKVERKKIADEKKALEVQRQQIEEEVAKKEKVLRTELTKQLRIKLAEEQAEQTNALNEELAEKTKKLSEMQKQEIELRKKQREIEQKRQEMELENQRKLDAERKKITEEATKKATEEQQLKMREKDEQLTSMKRQIDELKRKAEVGSQERQGEALEGTLLDLLSQTFPLDKFEEVPKGVHGADILQAVRNALAQECGLILWESKNTQSFNKNWITKLKTDQQSARADLAVLVSVVLPRGIQHFDYVDDIWIADHRMAISLATVIRQILINVARHKLISKHKDGVKDIVYNYVTGKEFAMHIKAIILAFNTMRADLEREKNAMQRIWKSREKQIETVIENVVGIRGSIEGYVGGKNLPPVESLMLNSTTNEENIIEEDKGTGETSTDDIPF
jgi:hypothetical protein